MNLTKKLLTLLAIFCVIASATAVCAADDGGYAGSQYVDDGYAGSQYPADDGYAGSQYQDDGGWAGSQYNESEEGLTDRPLIDPDYAHMEPAAGAPLDNETANATDAVSDDVASNATESASHAMPATGNPILALLAVGAVLGGASIISRRK